MRVVSASIVAALLLSVSQPTEALSVRAISRMHRRTSASLTRIFTSRLQEHARSQVRALKKDRKAQIVAAYSSVAISFSSSSSTSSISSPSTAPIVPYLSERDEILQLVNDARASAGYPPLRLHALLNLSAQRYAEDMEARHFFSHSDPDGNGSLDRIRAVGYVTPPCECAWRYWTGENIASGQKTAVEVMRDWMASPQHRENILSPSFEELGVGRQGNTWVQHFGSVKS